MFAGYSCAFACVCVAYVRSIQSTRWTIMCVIQIEICLFLYFNYYSSRYTSEQWAYEYFVNNSRFVDFNWYAFYLFIFPIRTDRTCDQMAWTVWVNVTQYRRWTGLNSFVRSDTLSNVVSGMWFRVWSTVRIFIFYRKYIYKYDLCRKSRCFWIGVLVILATEWRIRMSAFTAHTA